MDVNKAIIINDQYNDTLVAIENVREHLSNCDIEADEFWAKLDTDLEIMEDIVQMRKRKLINEIEL